MTASMYILLVLALIFANAPFVTAKFFGVLPLKRKHIGHHLIELAAGFILTAVLATSSNPAPARFSIKTGSFTPP